MPDLAGITHQAIKSDRHYRVTVAGHHDQLGEREYVQHWSGKALRRAIRLDPSVIERIIKLEEPAYS